MGRAPSGSFVGREHELATLARALADVQRGEGRFLLVTGEPGIGKTTLVERFIASATEANLLVGVGRAWEGAGAPPWWIWREALRPLGVEIELPKTLANDEARFACLEMVAETVRDIAASAPLILVLDDLQWADASSLLAAKLLARTLARMPLLLIGTLREPAPIRKDLAPALADLRREAIAVPLAAFTRSDIATLAAQRGLDGSAIDTTLSISGGNPLFATRLLDDAEARPELAGGREPPIPTGVMDVLVRHLDQLGDDGRLLVEWAAVAGDPLDLPLVATASGLSSDQALAAVDHARRTRVFTRAGPARFAHDLLRAATYGSIETPRRAAMHLAIARALGGRADAEIRIADHTFLADPDSEEAVRTARAGAKTAIARLAYEQAVVMAERVVLGEERAGRQAALATALALLSEARLLAGDAEGSTAAAERALSVARKSDEAEPYARAALALGLRRTMGMPNPALVAAIGEALERMNSSAPENATETLALRCGLEARLGAALQPMIDPPRALASARMAIERARGSSDRMLLARTIHEARPAFRLLEPFAERHMLDSELLSLATVLGDTNLAAHAHGRLFWLALEAGDAISTDLHLAEYEGLATSLKVAQHEVGAMSARAVRAGMCGDWDEANRALDLLDATRERWAPALASRMPIDHVIFMRANLCALRGSPASGDAAVSAAPPMMRPLLELVFDTRLGRLDRAAKSYPAVAGTYLQGEVGVRFLIYLAEAAIALREATHAAQLSSLLEARSGRHAVGTPFPSYEGSIDRLLAGLAILQGDSRRADRLYEAAIAAEEALGATPFAERTRRERDSHAAPGRPASRAAGRPHRGRDDLALTHEGDTWIVHFGEEEARIKDAVGLQYVAYLLARPNVPVSAIELFSLRALVRGDAPLQPTLSDAGERLDPSAVAAYRARARDLRLRLDDASSRHDAGAVEAAKGELELIEEELRAAVGLGGRMRRASSETERVRVNVTTRIRKAIERLRERAPQAAHHLATAIRTGATCIYRRSPENGGIATS